jgi:hypothetical protein
MVPIGSKTYPSGGNKPHSERAMVPLCRPEELTHHITIRVR